MKVFSPQRKMVVVFCTLTLYLTGLGLIIPMLPLLAQNLKASPMQVGLLLAFYSAMYFLFAPFWGKISDHIGRRPVLLICLLGESLSLLGFALSEELFLLYILRGCSGVFTASVSTLTATISDLSQRHHRSKQMGLVGVAFGLGFILGPLLGGLMYKLGIQLGEGAPFGIHFPFLVLSALAFINFLFAFFFFTETSPRKVKATDDPTPTPTPAPIPVPISMKTAPSGEGYRLSTKLLLAYGLHFFVCLSLAMMEVPLIFFLRKQFMWPPSYISFSFAYVGLVLVLTQGFLLRKIMPLWGERKTLFAGISTMGLGFLLLSLSPSLALVISGVTFVTLGNALCNSSLMGMISLITPQKKQGHSMGWVQSSSSLARIAGPSVGTFLFSYVGAQAPFGVSCLLAVLCGFAFLLGWRLLPQAGKRCIVKA